MPIYTISRSWLLVDVIEVEAENEEKALASAKAADDSRWKACDSVGGITYQVERG